MDSLGVATEQQPATLEELEDRVYMSERTTLAGVHAVNLLHSLILIGQEPEEAAAAIIESNRRRDNKRQLSVNS